MAPEEATPRTVQRGGAGSETAGTGDQDSTGGNASSTPRNQARPHQSALTGRGGWSLKIALAPVAGSRFFASVVTFPKCPGIINGPHTDDKGPVSSRSRREAMRLAARRHSSPTSRQNPHSTTTAQGRAGHTGQWRPRWAGNWCSAQRVTAASEWPRFSLTQRSTRAG